VCLPPGERRGTTKRRRAVRRRTESHQKQASWSALSTGEVERFVAATTESARREKSPERPSQRLIQRTQPARE
jgi:hypothetical protein